MYGFARKKTNYIYMSMYRHYYRGCLSAYASFCWYLLPTRCCLLRARKFQGIPAKQSNLTQLLVPPPPSRRYFIYFAMQSCWCTAANSSLLRFHQRIFLLEKKPLLGSSRQSSFWTGSASTLWHKVAQQSFSSCPWRMPWCPCIWEQNSPRHRNVLHEWAEVSTWRYTSCNLLGCGCHIVHHGRTTSSL